MFPAFLHDLINANALDLDLLSLAKPEADERFDFLVRRAKILSRTGQAPDPLHVMKAPIYLYILSRVIYENQFYDEFNLKTRLYCFNKALNGCSLYYKVALPSVFFLNYSSGVVLGDCKYGENLVIYQGVTVGGYGGKMPSIGSNVILMPNVIVSGETIIGDNVVVSAGTVCINKNIPDNCIVYQQNKVDSNIEIHQMSDMKYINFYLNDDQN